MKKYPFAFLTILTILGSTAQVYAEDSSDVSPAFRRISKSAQKAQDKGQYKKAETLWRRAIGSLDETQPQNAPQANAYKRLGETLLKEGKYFEANTNLKQAANVYKALIIADAELAGDQSMLLDLYRPVDITLLGKSAQEALTQANLVSFYIIKKEDGSNHVEIELPDHYTKDLGDKVVDQLGFDRNVSFDITSMPDGTIKFDDIKGFRVHVKMWVNILNSSFHSTPSGEHTAEVTASKMGITKAVTTTLTDHMYEPVAGLVSQLMVTNPTPAISGAVSVKTTHGEPCPPPAATNAGTVAAPTNVQPAGASSNGTPATAPSSINPALSPSSNSTPNSIPTDGGTMLAPTSNDQTPALKPALPVH